MNSRRKFLQQASLLGAAPFIGIETSKKSFSVAHITDVHIKPYHNAEAGFAKALQKINKISKLSFIVNTGDAIMDALETTKEKAAIQWELFHKIVKENNSLPMYHCIGNHDIWGWF